MKKLTVNTGDKFNKLTVIRMSGVNEKGFSVADCRCDCGKETTIRIAELRSGHTKSCGCESSTAKSLRQSEGIIGKKFGRLTVQTMEGTDNRKYRLCNCLCECGQTVKIRIAPMLRGELRSCGCLQQEKAMENLSKAQKTWTTHGLSSTLTGRSWNAMIQRCYNPKNESFHRYGGVGTVCCEFLRASPLNIIICIGERQSALMSIDRIDSMLGYYCGSCPECAKNDWSLNIQWSTAKEQALNRTNNRMIEIDGVIKTASQWKELLGLSTRKAYSLPRIKE